MWEALLTAGIRGLHAVETAVAPQQAARRRIDGLRAALLHAVNTHERPTHGDAGTPRDASSQSPADAGAHPDLDPGASSAARVVLLPLPGWPALSTAGHEGVEAASVAVVNALRAHGRMLPLLTGGPRARERAAALMEAVAEEEEEDAVVYVWPGVQDAVAPHDTDADAALFALRGQLGDDSDHPEASGAGSLLTPSNISATTPALHDMQSFHTSKSALNGVLHAGLEVCAGTDTSDGAERAWDPSFLWMALRQINSPTPATLLGGSAAIAAAIMPPLTVGATHAVTPQALLAEAPVPAHRQLTALWDAGVLRCGQEPVVQVPNMYADDPTQVLRAVLPAALSARPPTLRAFQSLQVRANLRKAPKPCLTSVWACGDERPSPFRLCTVRACGDRGARCINIWTPHTSFNTCRLYPKPSRWLYLCIFTVCCAVQCVTLYMDTPPGGERRAARARGGAGRGPATL
jgi:hypothetical protein